MIGFIAHGNQRQIIYDDPHATGKHGAIATLDFPLEGTI
jgi:hypothetical protein